MLRWYEYMHLLGSRDVRNRINVKKRSLIIVYFPSREYLQPMPLELCIFNLSITMYH